MMPLQLSISANATLLGGGANFVPDTSMSQSPGHRKQKLNESTNPNQTMRATPVRSKAANRTMNESVANRSGCNQQ